MIGENGEIIKEFKANMTKYKPHESYIHAPYYINLASAKNNIFFGSVTVLREELERGTKLGVKYLMTHLGSAKDLGQKQAIKKVASGINPGVEEEGATGEQIVFTQCPFQPQRPILKRLCSCC